MSSVQQSPQQPQPSKRVWQPLHPDVRGKLDPQYVKLHDEVLQYVQPDDLRTWDGSARMGSVVASTGIGPVPVGKIEDIHVDGLRIRVYQPSSGPSSAAPACSPSSASPSSKPPGGWPVFLWFHGGGFALGDLSSDADLLTRVCQDANCLVVTVDYRLAPEHPYPAAVEDGVKALRWLASPTGGVQRLGVDVSRIVLGGSSAGATLALATALHNEADAAPPRKQGQGPEEEGVLRFCGQVLVVPVLDNTASPDSDLWSVNGPTAPWLTPARMLWYRRMWLRSEEDALNWDASPSRASQKLLAGLPPTFIAVAEADLLAPEGLAFADRLKAAGVYVETKVFAGCTHGLLTYCGYVTIHAYAYFPSSKMDKGMELLNDCVSAVKKALSGCGRAE